MTDKAPHFSQLSVPNINLIDGEVEAKRLEIKAYFNQTYQSYEALFTLLASDAAYYERPCPLRHPLIFYFGHTATFFANKLRLANLLPERIDPKIESMCAIGVDEMSWDDLNTAHYEWPSVAAIKAYRQKVNEAVNALIDAQEFTLPIDWESPMWPIMMGIEHERIHLETSSVLIRQLPITSVVSSALFPVCPNQDKAPLNSLLSVPEQAIDIVHTDPAKTYGWDNEYGEHHAQVKAFKAGKYLVSNQEYRPFVEANGYDKEEYWSEEGNRWRQFTPNKHPEFWLQKQGEWFLRCMTDEINMPWNWPVEVNALEADAFCQWMSQQTGQPIRLPSEDEYLSLYQYTQAQTFAGQANHNLQEYASSTPIDAHDMNGFYDVIGNVWQWTQTPIYPFEGFKVHPLYDDFTAPTFDNQHNIFKGGSWISTGNEINGHSRYAFRRHFYQHAGFRYIESDATVQTHFSTYETDASVSQYCEFHYGDEYFGVENFAKAYAQVAIDAIQADPVLQNKHNLSVLEVGCSVGRASFELAKKFDKVTGLDFSARFIQVANQLKTEDNIHYTVPIEGEIMDFKSASLSGLDLKETASRCSFYQQDATNMKAHFSDYDMVVAVNLIDRLYAPQHFLRTLANRLNAGGLLMLASPYTWLEEFTEKQYWLGGYKDEQTGENVSTLEGLHTLLDAQFELIQDPFDLPFVIRETQRKYQHSLSQVTLWRKRNATPNA